MSADQNLKIAALLAGTAASGGLGLALGQGGVNAQNIMGLNIAGTQLEVSPFETRQMSIAVAKDRKTGRQFNIIKLPTGKMMALYSVENLKATLPFADDSEMMYSGHAGTLR